MSSGLRVRILGSGIDRSEAGRSGGRGYAGVLEAVGVGCAAHGAARGRRRGRDRRHGLLEDTRRTNQAALKLGETRLHEDPVIGCWLGGPGDAIFALAAGSLAQAAFGEVLVAAPLQFLAGGAGLLATRLHFWAEYPDSSCPFSEPRGQNFVFRHVHSASTSSTFDSSNMNSFSHYVRNGHVCTKE